MLYAIFAALVLLELMLAYAAVLLLRSPRTLGKSLGALACVAVFIAAVVPLWFVGVLSYLAVTGGSFGP